MKQCHELNAIAVEVVNQLAKKDISINEAKYVLERANDIILLETKLCKID